MIGCFPPPLTWPIPNGIGGVIGDMILRFPALFVGAYPSGAFATAVGCVFALPTAWMMLFAAGIVGRTEAEEDEGDHSWLCLPRPARLVMPTRTRTTKAAAGLRSER
ncbi:hypothetical protein AJ87_34170 [Rhizobium yanglingense]|nr:hypothetical protein AJ87_34170 [Rhizobium yanglingense]